jgi:flagellar basal-body rod modification protein FlgD
MPDAVSGSTGLVYTPGASTTVTRDDQGSSKDMFLKLLVAQMKYQDPANPASSSEFMAQTATMTQVEKLEQLVQQNASMLVMQESGTAGALVGRTVTYTDTNGASKTGVVSSVRLASRNTEAAAVVDGVAIPIGRLTEISVTSPPSSTPPGTPPKP